MTDSKETCEMLPCPLCGRQPDYQHFNISQNMRGRIICTCGLGLTQGRNDTEDGTILKWNTRSDHAVQAANERKAEQAIAATVGVGTCRNERTATIVKVPHKDYISIGHYECGLCGASITPVMRYCHGCGARLKGASE